MNFKAETRNAVHNAEKKLASCFARLEEIALTNQAKVLEAFRKHQVALRHFSGTTGYGYDDIGRDTLNRVYADVFHAEEAIVSPHILSGTHALTVALFGVLRPGDTMLSAVGKPYDTMESVIAGNGIGSLRDFGIGYAQIELNDDRLDLRALTKALTEQRIRLVYLQRSRGYAWRSPLLIEDIENAVNTIKKCSPETIVFVDNCYGEFVETQEPTDVGADLVAGSLIKNAGGGIAPTGGYIAGKKRYLDLVANRLTAPSVGGEIGSYAAGYQYFYQGLFLAPHVTLQALKGAALMSCLFSELGYPALPDYRKSLGDIVCSVEFRTQEELIAFCRKIQESSPIDSHVTPYPWDMPGYADRVIMAAGCFVQGASIELSCDSPIRKPYIAYLQGGLTYEHVKLAAMNCLEVVKV